VRAGSTSGAAVTPREHPAPEAQRHATRDEDDAEARQHRRVVPRATCRAAPKPWRFSWRGASGRYSPNRAFSALTTVQGTGYGTTLGSGLGIPVIAVRPCRLAICAPGIACGSAFQTSYVALAALRSVGRRIHPWGISPTGSSATNRCQTPPNSTRRRRASITVSRVRVSSVPEPPVISGLRVRFLHGSAFARGAAPPPDSLFRKRGRGHRDNGARGGRAMRGSGSLPGARGTARRAAHRDSSRSDRRGRQVRCGALTRWQPHPRIRLVISRRTSRP
jgi:hypothetical protein